MDGMRKWWAVLAGCAMLALAGGPSGRAAGGSGGGTGMQVHSTDDPDTPEVESNPEWNDVALFVFWEGLPVQWFDPDGRRHVRYPRGTWRCILPNGSVRHGRSKGGVETVDGPGVDGRQVRFKKDGKEHQIDQGPTGAATLTNPRGFVARGASY